ncbi:hypothetical protein FD723_40295 (plasmid) [Nostoc sp. C052]|uniref:hypothetical protein n=1 Tax=Nostoc sp. C052 TaxID=2576902 RepID=UPI0015C40328|nr:hypothetical protein [Nostoc sp. C052]QLE46455.1 hypothetical protein FD723_40295 [Nostoc sp. C052]
MRPRKYPVTEKDKYELISQVEWSRERDNAPICEKVWKTPKGIIEELFANKVLTLSVYSPRPYKLKQRCDGTIDDPLCDRFSSNALGFAKTFEYFSCNAIANFGN